MNIMTCFSKETLIILFFIVFAPLQAQGANAAGKDNANKPQLSSSLLHGKIKADQYNALLSNISLKRSAKVIVQLALPEASLQQASGLSVAAIEARQQAVQARQDAFLANVNLSYAHQVKPFKHIPFLALEIDEDLLDELMQSNDVLSIREDTLHRISLDSSIPYIGADVVWDEGYTGANQVVAILDTGVDAEHVFLLDPEGASKVVSEACYSSTYVSLSAVSLCTDGSTLSGSGANCTSFNGCNHGTHVAGIVAGNGSDFSGVAKDASLISIQVFSGINDPGFCGSNSCIAAFTSDIVQGLERVYTLATEGGYAIAAVNLSLGGGVFATAKDCDDANPATKQAIDNLRSIGVATVIASGNESLENKMSAPACISSAVSVGATNNADQVASFSNSASWLSLLAPGVNITSSVPNDAFANLSGTSMATPHVAGAFALLKSKLPTATVDQLLAAMTNTGHLISDTKNGLVKPRVQLDRASGTLEFNSLPVNIILDNDFDGVAVQGDFNRVISTDSYNGSVLEGIGAGLNSFRYTPVLSQSGHYRVYGWWPASLTNTSEAVVTIRHDGGETQINVNQQTNGSQWNLLGDFSFSVGNSAYVEVSDPMGSMLVADAVRFEFLPLHIETNTLPVGHVGEAYNFSLSANGGRLPFVWDIAEGSLPDELLLQADGSFSGSPGLAGTSDFIVQLTDGSGDIVTQALSLVVSPNESSSAAFVDDFESGLLAPWNQLQSGSVQLVNDPTDGWVLRKVGNNDPNGGWAPLGSTLNDFDLILYTRKLNEAGGSSIRYSLTDTNGNGYGVRLTQTSGKLSIERRTAWKGSSLVNKVSLPDGMALGQWYTLRFSRQADVLHAAVYTGRVDPDQAIPLAESSASNSAYESFDQVNINGGYDFDTDNVRVFGSVSPSPSSPLSIATVQLSNGVVAAPYNTALIANGGTSPYSWSIIAGALPAGLTLQIDGVISGEPVQEESSDFTVQVTDDSGAIVTQTLSLSIVASSTAAVFEDDFESGTLAPWNQLQSGSVQLVNDPTDGWVLRKVNNNDPNGGWAPLGSALTDFELILYTRKPNEAGGSSIRYSLTDANGNGYGVKLTGSSGQLSIERRTTWSRGSIGNNALLPDGFVLNQWYTLRFSRQAGILSAAVYMGRVDPDQAIPLAESSASSSTYESFDQININGGYDFDTDNVRIFD